MSPPISPRVVKFGSSVLRSPRDLAALTAEIGRRLASGERLVVVVSAFAGTTDRLFARAGRSTGRRPARELLPAAVGRLVATGETEASALAALALAAARVPVALLDARQAGLVTAGEPLDAELAACDAGRLLGTLERVEAVVVPGYVGHDADGETTLLGRGGSDLTALFLASRLGGPCTLYKDADGLYTADPRRDPGALRYATASWATALAVGGGLVQEKAIRFAAARLLEFEIAAPGGRAGTRVGPLIDALALAEPGAEIGPERQEICA